MLIFSRLAFISGILLGLAMFVLGILFIVMGFNARGDIREALEKERVYTSPDSSIPGVIVHDPQTAKAQQDAIEAHTFGKWGPYSGLSREDPNRQVYLNGITLRNSLNIAIVGFGVADLAIALGGVTLVLGLIIAGFAFPVHLAISKTSMTKRALYKKSHYSTPSRFVSVPTIPLFPPILVSPR